MTSAIPGGAPGYDNDKKFGNNVAHSTHEASRRLRKTYPPKCQCQGTADRFRNRATVTGFFPFGEWFLLSVIPGRLDEANPESRDSGFALRAPRNDSV
jgi:hypothetical protein